MSMSLSERENKVIAGIQKVRFFPLPVVGGDGSYLILEDGRRVLDMSATWGAATLGYNHPGVTEAVCRAVDGMAGVSSICSTSEPSVCLAEELLDLVPGGEGRRVWFGHCGSEANDAMTRAVPAATGRGRFVSFIGGTHGGFTGGISVSGYDALLLNTASTARSGQIYLPYPDPYRPPFPGDVGQQVLDYFEYLLRTMAPPEQIAGVIIEGVMCDGGDVVPPPGFLAGLSELCKRHGILLIFDEVKVGLGRTGAFHSFDAEGVVPDLISYGKALGGGLPLGALVGPADIMDNPRGLTITTTQGNPVAASAGRAVLRAISEGRLWENAEARGNQLIEGLRQLANKHPLIGDVRGRGLVIGVDLVTDRASKEPAASQCAKTVFRAQELGAVFFYVGGGSNVIELTPPITLSETEAEEGLQILDQALDDVEQGRVSDAAVAEYAGW